MTTKNPFDEIRCINPSTGAVQFIRRWVCEDVKWQNATGFIPQPIDDVVAIQTNESKIETVYETGNGFVLDGEPMDNDEITMQEIKTNEIKRRGRPKKENQ